jgi:broad specificity polyphosphatase/5'/3'-nucleotidase SurE
MEKLKDTAKQNIKDNSININTPQIKKKTWKHTETTKWTPRGLQKHQSKKKETIKKETYEIKKTTQDMKEKLNKDVENLRKKSVTNTGNTMSL